MERARTETTPIPTIYGEEISRLRQNHDIISDDMLKQIPSFKSVNTILYRQRHKTLPRLPESRPEINLEDKYAKTDGGDQFLHRVNADILIFTTDKNIEHLCTASTVFCDGTFYTCPKLFDQIYCVHAQVFCHMVPLVYCLLSNRSAECYTQMFEYLCDLAGRQGLQFAPHTVQLDFERAAHNAVRGVFPAASVRGCFFHYTQCIWRRVQKEGLASDYKEDGEVKKLVRRAAALPLVPCDKIEDVWLDAVAESPASPKVTAFMDYVTTSWVEGQGFIPEIWNHFENQGHRTNNRLEGWHNKIKKLLKKSHPNTFEVIQLFQREQSLTEVTILRLSHQPKEPSRRRRYRAIDARIASLKQQLLNQSLNEITYADHVGDLLHLHQ
ncbi:uncharacterized protein [Haliotis asinina]|uniref:uncharacterized protein n=1 Tax=Haliotis asinina TaxID=109174 RepID=UPI0035322F02